MPVPRQILQPPSTYACGYQLPRISSITPPAPECISIALCDELVEQGWRSHLL